jgi:CRISPR-associated protein Cas1
MNRIKTQAVMMSSRANVFYLERVKVCQDGDRVVYLSRDGNIDKMFNIPEKNTAFVLLGKGSSITDAAARKLAESGVMLGFCGSGGSPLFSSTSPVFLEPHSEYRPTEYMQKWYGIWQDEAKRLTVAKQFLSVRAKWVCKSWLKLIKIEPNEKLLSRFSDRIEKSTNATELLLAEADWAKNLYATLAKHFKIDSFTRQNCLRSSATKPELINGFLDHGNYIAYGYSSVVLTTLGISYAFPVLHGKTRKGALVFDVADLFKDAIIMPGAFLCGSKNMPDQDFRYWLIEKCYQENLLDNLFDTFKKIVQENTTYNQ